MIVTQNDSLAGNSVLPVIEKKIKRIPSLDGLRACSVFLVLLGHTSQTMNWSGRSFDLFLNYAANARLGVAFFFGISGYLITYLLQAEFRRTGTICLGAYYRRRILRIFPAFYSYLAVLIVLTALGFYQISKVKFFSAGSFLWNYKYLWDFVGDEGNWYLGHFWTLAIEEQFYLFWPVTMLLAGPRRAAKIALAVIALMPISRVLVYGFFPDSRGQIPIMFHTASDMLMFGCVGALWWNEARFQTWLKRLDRLYIPAVSVAFVLVVSPALLLTYRGMWLCTAGITLESLAIASIIFWLIRHTDSFVGRIMNSPILVHVGIISYSLYLWQQLFLTPNNHSWSGIFPVNLLCTVVAAELSYWVIERTFLRLK